MNAFTKRAMKLTAHIEEELGKPASVFYAIREVDGRLVRGYWYQLWKDGSREEWYEFGFLHEKAFFAKRAIDRLVREKSQKTGDPSID